MIAVFRAHCLTELRQQRTVCVAIALLAPIGAVALCLLPAPSLGYRGPLLAGLCMLALLVCGASDAIPMDLRGPQRRLLPRLPRGAGPALAAKLTVLAASTVAIGVWGWCCGANASRTLLGHDLGSLFEGVQTDLLLALGAATCASTTWLLALSAWWRRPGAAIGGVSAAIAAYHTVPWLLGMQADLRGWFGFTTGWTMAALSGGAAAWTAYRCGATGDRQRGRGLLRAGFVCAAVAPFCWHGGTRATAWFNPDPRAAGFAIDHCYASTDGATVFANVRDRRVPAAHNALRIAVADGSYEHAGAAGSEWGPVWPRSLLATPQRTGQRILQLAARDGTTAEVIDTQTGRRLAHGRADAAVAAWFRQLTRVDLPDGGTFHLDLAFRPDHSRFSAEQWVVHRHGKPRVVLPVGRNATARLVGTGLRIDRRWTSTGELVAQIVDFTRDSTEPFLLPRDASYVVRPGRWLCRRSTDPTGRPIAPRWTLFDPHTQTHDEAPGMLASDLRALPLDDWRVLVFTRRHEAWVADTRSGGRRRLARDSWPVGMRTPAGAEILWIGRRLARLDSENETLAQTREHGEAIRPIACLDEDTVLVHTERQILQLRFGSDSARVLFP